MTLLILARQSRRFCGRAVRQKLAALHPTPHDDQDCRHHKRDDTQANANAIDFINYVDAKFPFWIRTIRTDRGHEFYQLLTYPDDVDLKKKLTTWERFYNYGRPHGAHGGKTPCELLREKLF